MDNKYFCNTCNYVTRRSNNLKKHMLTQKHIINNKKDNKPVVKISNVKSNKLEKLFDKSDLSDDFSDLAENLSMHKLIPYNKKYVCKKCKFEFAHSQSLYNHKKFNRCKKTQKFDNDKIVISKEEYNKLKNTAEKLEREKDKILDLANKNADATIITAKSANQSMRMMTYAIRNFADAPPVKLLEKSDAMKLITHKKNSEFSIEEHFVYNYAENLLHKFIGDMIIRSYKKENPEEQSMWATDTSRMSFIVMQILEDTGENEWVNDKSGLKIIKLIIKPVLEEIKHKMIKYINMCAKEGNDNDGNLKDCMEKMLNAKKIILEITKETLELEILKYIAPSFGLDLLLVEKIVCTKCKKKYIKKNVELIKNKPYCTNCIDNLLGENSECSSEYSENLKSKKSLFTKIKKVTL